MYQLKKVTYPSIKSDINILGLSTISVNNEFSLNVVNSGKDNLCHATFTASCVCPDHPDKFSIFVTISGVFACEEEDKNLEISQLHKSCYDDLFPYMQSIIADLTMKAGLQPMLVEKAPIDFSKIGSDKTND